MAANQKIVLRKDGELTPTSDKKGIDIYICDPDWFDEKKKFKVVNAPNRNVAFEYSGFDLNFLARVLFAEASGSAKLIEKNERDAEKEAILNVKFFRLGRTDYPDWRVKSKTFTEVCSAPGQFESVGPPPTSKFRDSTKSHVEKFDKKECSDFIESIDAIKRFLDAGPNTAYAYDNFRGGSGSRGTTIGRSRFWLSTTGARLLADEINEDEKKEKKAEEIKRNKSNISAANQTKG